MHEHKKNRNVCSAFACVLGVLTIVCFCFCVVGVLTTVCFYSFDGEEDSLDVPTFFSKQACSTNRKESGDSKTGKDLRTFPS